MQAYIALPSGVNSVVVSRWRRHLHAKDLLVMPQDTETAGGYVLRAVIR